VKRRDLIKLLEQMGCILVRNGGRHDWYTNPQTQTQTKQSQLRETGSWSFRNRIPKLELGTSKSGWHPVWGGNLA